MAGKLQLLVGFGAGYVVGARAGRERYDQIAGKAQELWRAPRVQEKADQAQQAVKEKAGHAQQFVKEKVGDKDNGGPGSTAPPGTSPTSGTTGTGPRTGPVTTRGTSS